MNLNRNKGKEKILRILTIFVISLLMIPCISIESIAEDIPFSVDNPDSWMSNGSYNQDFYDALNKGQLDINKIKDFKSLDLSKVSDLSKINPSITSRALAEQYGLPEDFNVDFEGVEGVTFKEGVLHHPNFEEGISASSLKGSGIKGIEAVEGEGDLRGFKFITGQDEKTVTSLEGAIDKVSPREDGKVDIFLKGNDQPVVLEKGSIAVGAGGNIVSLEEDTRIVTPDGTMITAQGGESNTQISFGDNYYKIDGPAIVERGADSSFDEDIKAIVNNGGSLEVHLGDSPGSMHLTARRTDMQIGSDKFNRDFSVDMKGGNLWEYSLDSKGSTSVVRGHLEVGNDGNIGTKMYTQHHPNGIKLEQVHHNQARIGTLSTHLSEISRKKTDEAAADFVRDKIPEVDKQIAELRAQMEDPQNRDKRSYLRERISQLEEYKYGLQSVSTQKGLENFVRGRIDNLQDVNQRIITDVSEGGKYNVGYQEWSKSDISVYGDKLTTQNKPMRDFMVAGPNVHWGRNYGDQADVVFGKTVGKSAGMIYSPPQIDSGGNLLKPDYRYLFSTQKGAKGDFGILGTRTPEGISLTTMGIDNDGRSYAKVSLKKGVLNLAGGQGVNSVLVGPPSLTKNSNGFYSTSILDLDKDGIHALSELEKAGKLQDIDYASGESKGKTNVLTDLDAIKETTDNYKDTRRRLESVYASVGMLDEERRRKLSDYFSESLKGEDLDRLQRETGLSQESIRSIQEIGNLQADGENEEAFAQLSRLAAEDFYRKHESELRSKDLEELKKIRDLQSEGKYDEAFDRLNQLRQRLSSEGRLKESNLDDYFFQRKVQLYDALGEGDKADQMVREYYESNKANSNEMESKLMYARRLIQEDPNSKEAQKILTDLRTNNQRNPALESQIRSLNDMREKLIRSNNFDELIKRGDLKGAEELLMQNPSLENSARYRQLGDLAEKRGDTEAALRFRLAEQKEQTYQLEVEKLGRESPTENVIDLSERFAKVSERVARTGYANKEYALAELTARSSLALDENNIGVQQVLSGSLTSQDKFEENIKEWESFTKQFDPKKESDQTDYYHSQVGLMNAHLDNVGDSSRFNKARETYSDAVRSLPEKYKPLLDREYSKVYSQKARETYHELDGLDGEEAKYKRYHLLREVVRDAQAARELSKGHNQEAEALLNDPEVRDFIVEWRDRTVEDFKRALSAEWKANEDSRALLASRVPGVFMNQMMTEDRSRNLQAEFREAVKFYTPEEYGELTEEIQEQIDANRDKIEAYRDSLSDIQARTGSRLTSPLDWATGAIDANEKLINEYRQDISRFSDEAKDLDVFNKQLKTAYEGKRNYHLQMGELDEAVKLAAEYHDAISESQRRLNSDVADVMDIIHEGDDSWVFTPEGYDEAKRLYEHNQDLIQEWVELDGLRRDTILQAETASSSGNVEVDPIDSDSARSLMDDLSSGNMREHEATLARMQLREFMRNTQDAELREAVAKTVIESTSGNTGLRDSDYNFYGDGLAVSDANSLWKAYNNAGMDAPEFIEDIYQDDDYQVQGHSQLAVTKGLAGGIYANNLDVYDDEERNANLAAEVQNNFKTEKMGDFIEFMRKRYSSLEDQYASMSPEQAYANQLYTAATQDNGKAWYNDAWNGAWGFIGYGARKAGDGFQEVGALLGTDFLGESTRMQSERLLEENAMEEVRFRSAFDKFMNLNADTAVRAMNDFGYVARPGEESLSTYGLGWEEREMLRDANIESGGQFLHNLRISAAEDETDISVANLYKANDQARLNRKINFETSMASLGYQETDEGWKYMGGQGFAYYVSAPFQAFDHIGNLGNHLADGVTIRDEIYGIPTSYLSPGLGLVDYGLESLDTTDEFYQYDADTITAQQRAINAMIPLAEKGYSLRDISRMQSSELVDIGLSNDVVDNVRFALENNADLLSLQAGEAYRDGDKSYADYLSSRSIMERAKFSMHLEDYQSAKSWANLAMDTASSDSTRSMAQSLLDEAQNAQDWDNRLEFGKNVGNVAVGIYGGGPIFSRVGGAVTTTLAKSKTLQAAGNYLKGTRMGSWAYNRFANWRLGSMQEQASSMVDDVQGNTWWGLGKRFRTADPTGYVDDWMNTHQRFKAAAEAGNVAEAQLAFRQLSGGYSKAIARGSTLGEGFVGEQLRAVSTVARGVGRMASFEEGTEEFLEDMMTNMGGGIGGEAGQRHFSGDSLNMALNSLLGSSGGRINTNVDTNVVQDRANEIYRQHVMDNYQDMSRYAVYGGNTYSVEATPEGLVTLSPVDTFAETGEPVTVNVPGEASNVIRFDSLTDLEQVTFVDENNIPTRQNIELARIPVEAASEVLVESAPDLNTYDQINQRKNDIIAQQEQMYEDQRYALSRGINQEYLSQRSTENSLAQTRQMLDSRPGAEGLTVPQSVGAGLVSSALGSLGQSFSQDFTPLQSSRQQSYTQTPSYQNQEAANTVNRMEEIFAQSRYQQNQQNPDSPIQIDYDQDYETAKEYARQTQHLIEQSQKFEREGDSQKAQRLSSLAETRRQDSLKLFEKSRVANQEAAQIAQISGDSNAELAVTALESAALANIAGLSEMEGLPSLQRAEAAEEASRLAVVAESSAETILSPQTETVLEPTVTEAEPDYVAIERNGREYGRHEIDNDLEPTGNIQVDITKAVEQDFKPEADAFRQQVIEQNPQASEIEVENQVRAKVREFIYNHEVAHTTTLNEQAADAISRVATGIPQLNTESENQILSQMRESNPELLIAAEQGSSALFQHVYENANTDMKVNLGSVSIQPISEASSVVQESSRLVRSVSQEFESKTQQVSEIDETKQTFDRLMSEHQARIDTTEAEIQELRRELQDLEGRWLVAKRRNELENMIESKENTLRSLRENVKGYIIQEAGYLNPGVALEISQNYDSYLTQEVEVDAQRVLGQEYEQMGRDQVVNRMNELLFSGDIETLKEFFENTKKSLYAQYANDPIQLGESLKQLNYDIINSVIRNTGLEGDVEVLFIGTQTMSIQSDLDTSVVKIRDSPGLENNLDSAKVIFDEMGLEFTGLSGGGLGLTFQKESSKYVTQESIRNNIGNTLSNPTVNSKFMKMESTSENSQLGPLLSEVRQRTFSSQEVFDSRYDLLRERSERMKGAGIISDVKSGPGGIQDIQYLLWTGAVKHGIDAGSPDLINQLVDAGFLTQEEGSKISEAEKFYRINRNMNHVITSSENDAVNPSFLREYAGLSTLEINELRRIHPSNVAEVTNSVLERESGTRVQSFVSEANEALAEIEC